MKFLFPVPASVLLALAVSICMDSTAPGASSTPPGGYLRLAIVTTNTAASGAGSNTFTNLQEALNWISAVPTNEVFWTDGSSAWNTNGGVGGTVIVEAGDYYCPTGFCIPQLGGGSIRITGRGMHVSRLSGDSNVLVCADASKPMWQCIELDRLSFVARRTDASAALIDLGMQFQTAFIHDNWFGRALQLPATYSGRGGVGKYMGNGFYGWGEAPVLGHPSRLIGLYCGGSDIVRLDSNIFWALGAGVVFQGDHLRARDNAYDSIRSGAFDPRRTSPVCGVPEWALSYGPCVLLDDGGDVIISGDHYFESDGGVFRYRSGNIYGEPVVSDTLFESVNMCLLARSASAFTVCNAKTLCAEIDPPWLIAAPTGTNGTTAMAGAQGISRLAYNSTGFGYWVGGTNIFTASSGGVVFNTRLAGGKAKGTNLTVNLAAGGTATLHITNGVTTVSVP